MNSSRAVEVARKPDGRRFAGADLQFLLPGRKPLVTLRDAAEYIMQLPEAEHGFRIGATNTRQSIYSPSVYIR